MSLVVKALNTKAYCLECSQFRSYLKASLMGIPFLVLRVREVVNWGLPFKGDTNLNELSKLPRMIMLSVMAKPAPGQDLGP